MHSAPSITFAFFVHRGPFGSLGRLTYPSCDGIVASESPIFNDPPLDGVASGHGSSQTYHQESGGDVSAAPKEEGEKMHRESDLRVTTMQSHIVSPQGKTKDDDAHAHHPVHFNQRIKELEDELDTFYRVCFVTVSPPILSLVLHSGQRGKAQQYWLFRRSWRSCVKSVNTLEVGKRSTHSRMKSYGSYVNVVNGSKRNSLNSCFRTRMASFLRCPTSQ